jgi:hypothetical protein
VAELAEEMTEVSRESEDSEPLLSRQLYDTLRETQGQRLEERMRMAGELVERGFLAEAERAEPEIAKDVDHLRQRVERAARSVLGDPAEATRRALGELEELSRELENEIARADPQSAARPADRSPGEATRQEDSQAGADELAGEGQPTRDDASSSSRGSPDAAADNVPFELGGWTGPGGPLTGDRFPQWSDRMRDVEGMLENPELREELARIHDRARNVRRDLKRHSQEPQWSLVRTLIAKPLVELQSRLREELARIEPTDKLVPVDRDPVPPRFLELVRRYYERLGSGE